ncbi:hypothetical protein PIIN_09762 [Serendipita indica DSM 11827]|uniref:F-box domain-containing protein n=1 Tax=Serendipita indica (strain DSM 11827) TaxID=1109443 RepID=G4TWS9_SERID|nr:hypothetical protein PIIN_09762 [Serendipita indica DSM 11827]
MDALELPNHFWQTVLASPNLESLDLRQAQVRPNYTDIKLNNLRDLWIANPDWIGLVEQCPSLFDLRVESPRHLVQYRDYSFFFQVWQSYRASVHSTGCYHQIYNYSPRLEELGVLGVFTHDKFSDAIPCFKSFKNLTCPAMPPLGGWNMGGWLSDSSDDDDDSAPHQHVYRKPESNRSSTHSHRECASCSQWTTSARDQSRKEP